MTLPIPLPCAGDDCSEELPIRPEHASNFEGRAWYCPACSRSLPDLTPDDLMDREDSTDAAP